MRRFGAIFLGLLLLAGITAVRAAADGPDCSAPDALERELWERCLASDPPDAVPTASPRAAAVPRSALADGSSAAATALPASAPRVSLLRPILFQSQLSEPAPAEWQREWTPYCAAAAAIMVLHDWGLPGDATDLLARTFGIGRRGNSTDDPGIDPDGIAYLMQTYGGEGRIHVHRSPWSFIDDAVGRLNNGATLVALTTAGDHTVTVFGYEAISGGDVTALYAADPLSGYVGPVPIEEWFGSTVWMGTRFAAAGPQWQGTYVFVTYRDYR